MPSSSVVSPGISFRNYNHLTVSLVSFQGARTSTSTGGSLRTVALCRTTCAYTSYNLPFRGYDLVRSVASFRCRMAVSARSSIGAFQLDGRIYLKYAYSICLNINAICIEDADENVKPIPRFLRDRAYKTSTPYNIMQK